MWRILLVDDNPADVELTRLALEEAALPAELVACSGCAEAQGWLLAHREPHIRPQLVLLDLNLGDGSGHDLLAFIRGLEWLSEVPVVILSTSDYHRDRSRAADQGAADYIVKPNSFDEFVVALERLPALLA